MGARVQEQEVERGSLRGLPITKDDLITIREMFNEESRKRLPEVMEFLRKEYPEVIEWMGENGFSEPCCVLSKDSIIDLLLDIVLPDSDEGLAYEIHRIEVERGGEELEIPVIRVWIPTVGEDKLIIVLPDQVVGLMF